MHYVIINERASANELCIMYNIGSREGGGEVAATHRYRVTHKMCVYVIMSNKFRELLMKIECFCGLVNRFWLILSRFTFKIYVSHQNRSGYLFFKFTVLRMSRPLQLSFF